MDKDLYILLIYKELKGELSDSELQSLQAFYDESPANRELRDEIQLSWMLSQEVDEDMELDLDVDLDLAKVKSTLNHVSEQQPSVKVIPMWRRMASVAAILIPLVVGGFFLFQFFNKSEAAFYQATNEVKEIELEDGSKIWLNQNSALEVAANFNDTDRNVSLKGEAFFEVAKNQNKPFIIQTDDIKVSVLGTSFNIKENNNKLTVSVVSGKVKVESDNDSVILEKNEKVVFEKNKNQLSKSALSNNNEMSWKTGTFIYRNESLNTVVKQLGNIFSKKIDIENSAIADCRIYFVLNTSDFQTILNKVADAVNCEIKKTGTDSFQLSGGSCE